MNKNKISIILGILSIILLGLFFNKNKQFQEQKNRTNYLQYEISNLQSEIYDLEEQIEDLESEINSLSNIQTNRLSSNTYTSPSYGYSSSSLKSIVVLRYNFCEYFVLENSSGYVLAEWYGGNDPDVGDVIIGDINSYGMKDCYNSSKNSDCRFYIEDYRMWEDEVIEKLKEQCD